MKKFALNLQIPSSDEEKEDNPEPVEYDEGENEEEESEEQNSSDNETNEENSESKEVSGDLQVQDFSQNNSRLKLNWIDDNEQAEEQKVEFKFKSIVLDSENDSQEDLKEDPETAELRDDGIQIEGIESSGDLSYKWVEQVENIKIVEKGINLKEFSSNYALRMISQEFKLIRKLTETKHHMEQIVKKQKGKDRYGDLGPFKHTQVKLKSKEKAFDTSVDNYINANNIRSAKQRSLFIATQGPLNNTFLNFWKMVWQEKVSLILMLCPLQEGGKTKWAEYWPNENTDKEMNINDEFTITFEQIIESTIPQVK